jgi:hypothetical protein
MSPEKQDEILSIEILDQETGRYTKAKVSEIEAQQETFSEIENIWSKILPPKSSE